jgi:signal transduction histidine kinase/heme-degrading monooxygenase HmoA
MIVALSRFRVANGMETQVAHAFQQRPRAVEATPGFLWLEVFVDHDDPSLFYLLTRWTDLQSFESWHHSPAHRDAHHFIPKGLKLDATWTEIVRLDRLAATTGSPLTDVITDATLLVSDYAAEATAFFVFVITLDGTITTCTRHACEQLAAGQSLAGRSLFDLMPEVDSARLRAHLARPGRRSGVRLNFSAQQEVPFTLDCWLFVHPGGATLFGQPAIRGEQRLQDELMAINQELAALSRERSRDLRDERIGREAAERQNDERNTFLTVLAHELRQPIGGALAAMAVLRKINPDPALDHARSLVERQLRHINRLVEDLADTARLASGDLRLQFETVDIAEQLRALTTAWEATAQEQRKSFETFLPATPLTVQGDQPRLQQVFSNLVANALKYTPAGGRVRVTATLDADAAVVKVEDDGEGIAPDQLPRIFDLFRRASRTGAGLGVGLAVVKALVEAHHGTIQVSSAGEGLGATFTVRLPVP